MWSNYKSLGSTFGNVNYFTYICRMNKCLNCNTETKNNKFCNSSCAATYNNKGRKHSEETKLKIQQTVKNTIKENPELLLNRVGTKGIRIFEKIKTCTCCKKEFVAKRNELGNYKTYCSEECFIRIKKLNATGIKRQVYNGFQFDSNYEVIIAKFLDEKQIIWEQVKNPILYIDNFGKTRKYFPDFYIPKYNLYLDPKNKFCEKQQIEKLEKVVKLINLIYGEPQKIIDYINTSVV